MPDPADAWLGLDGGDFGAFGAGAAGAGAAEANPFRRRGRRATAAGSEATDDIETERWVGCGGRLRRPRLSSFEGVLLRAA